MQVKIALLLPWHLLQWLRIQLGKLPTLFVRVKEEPSSYTMHLTPCLSCPVLSAAALHLTVQWSLIQYQGYPDGLTSVLPGLPCALIVVLSEGEGYKYKEVVRKKAEREDMLGVECTDCQRFYEACQTWNSIAPTALPKCGHAVQGTSQTLS